MNFEMRDFCREVHLDKFSDLSDLNYPHATHGAHRAHHRTDRLDEVALKSTLSPHHTDTWVIAADCDCQPRRAQRSRPASPKSYNTSLSSRLRFASPLLSPLTAAHTQPLAQPSPLPVPHCPPYCSSRRTVSTMRWPRVSSCYATFSRTSSNTLNNDYNRTEFRKNGMMGGLV